jgi:hypothetical protein
MSRRLLLVAHRLLIVGLVSGCSFSAPKVTGDGGVDGAPDALPETCTAGQVACDGRTPLSCGPDNEWVPEQACDFTCAMGACVVPSNVPIADVAACAANAPALAPPADGSVVITASGGARVNCTPHCGDAAVTTIAATLVTAPAPGLAMFCFSSIDLAAGVDVTLPTTNGPAQALAFIVDGPVRIGSTINLDGLPGTASTAGEGAPGGFDGVGRTAAAGAQGGGGLCGGAGGAHIGSVNNWAGGGGGGAGGSVAGRQGGNGRSPNNDQTSPGGNGGVECGSATLIPLVGGAGGGGGGDGSCGGDCGWPSGGGGGALQISSRASIAIAGTIRARGGNGYGVAAAPGGNGGGGGGGAGGGILLEAPAVTVGGALIVDGGNGGPSAAGPGGAGASGANGPTMGASFTAAGQGGSGGGAGGGRIRINASGAACPGGASPVAACSTGVLTPQ